MKKSLIALAALAATASFAQSSVTISGLIDTGYAIVNGPATNGDIKGLRANNSATTVLTFAGSEDLGGGLKANFQFQITPDFLAGNGVHSSSVQNPGGDGAGQTSVGNAQQAFVGLSGNFGSIKLGRVNSASLDAWGTGSVFGTALGSGYGSNGNIFTRYSTAAAVSSYQTAPTRFNNAIRFETNAYSGFSGSVLVVPKNNQVGGAVAGDTTSDKSTNRQGVTEFAVKYNNGPLNVVYSNLKIESGAEGVVNLVSNTGATALTAGTNNKLNTLAANYTFGAATVYGAYWTEKQNTATAIDVKGYMLGGKYTMGATTLMASVGNSNEKSAANVDKKIYGIGADYALSKRTNLYARYENRDADSVSAADDKTKVTAIGVRHTF